MTSRRTELKAFLRAMRARLSPEEVGLPGETRRRRAPGLRIEEAASLADVSLTWYSALESGKEIRISEKLLDRIADALRLSPAERDHLHDLATPAEAGAPSEHDAVLQAVTKGFVTGPAFVCDAFWNWRTHNRAADAVYGFSGARDRNVLRRMFFDPDFRSLHAEWDRLARQMVHITRLSYGRAPSDTAARALIDELAAGSAEFRAWWASQGVRRFEPTIAVLNHPNLGRLSFTYASFAESAAVRSALPAFIVLQPAADAETERRMRDVLESHRIP